MGTHYSVYVIGLLYNIDNSMTVVDFHSTEGIMLEKIVSCT